MILTCLNNYLAVTAAPLTLSALQQHACKIWKMPCMSCMLVSTWSNKSPLPQQIVIGKFHLAVHSDSLPSCLLCCSISHLMAGDADWLS